MLEDNILCWCHMNVWKPKKGSQTDILKKKTKKKQDIQPFKK